MSENGGVEVTGLEELLKKMDEKFSPSKITQVEGKALQVSSRVAAVHLKNAVSKYSDTGATVKEVAVGRIIRVGGNREIKIGWAGDGSKGRWRLIHLNEFGYTPHGVFAGHSNATDSNGTSFYRPRGYGAVKQAFEDMKEPIKRLQIAELKRLIK